MYNNNIRSALLSSKLKIEIGVEKKRQISRPKVSVLVYMFGGGGGESFLFVISGKCNDDGEDDNF